MQSPNAGSELLLEPPVLRKVTANFLVFLSIIFILTPGGVSLNAPIKYKELGGEQFGTD